MPSGVLNGFATEGFGRVPSFSLARAGPLIGASLCGDGE